MGPPGTFTQWIDGMTGMPDGHGAPDSEAAHRRPSLKASFTP